MKHFESFAQQTIDAIVHKPKRWLFLSFLSLVVAIMGISKIESSFTVKVWLQPEDQRIKNLEEFERTFGSSETMDLAVYSKDGIFTKENLKTIHALTEEMWKIEGIVRVESVTNFNWIDTFEDDINIAPFIPEDFSYSKEELRTKRDLAVNDTQLSNNFISRSGEMVYIRSFLKTYDRTPPYGTIVTQVEKMLEKYKRDGIEIHMGGISAINDGLKKAADTDTAKVFPIVIIFLISVLYYFFRNILGVVYPFGLILMSIAFTFGIEGFLGLKFNNIISAVPAILMAIGLADAIHILVSYRHNILFEGQDNTTAAINSLNKNFLPTILTSITTAVGFLSLTSAEIAPIHDLGLLSGLGTIVAWFYTYFLLGPLLRHVSFTGQKVNDDVSQLGALYDFCFKHKNFINYFSPLLAIAMVWYGSNNFINADPVEYFDEGTPIKKTFRLLEGQYGGSRTIELVLDSGKDEGIKDPTFMKKAAQYISWLETQKEIIRVATMTKVIKKMNQTLHEGKNEYYRIPDTRREIADQLFLYTLGLPQGMDLKNQVSLNNRKVRVIIMWNINDTMHAIKKTDLILDQAKKIGLNVYEGGQTPIYNRVNDLVVKTFFTSMSYSIPIIFLIILLVFQDSKLAALSLIPNLFPLAVASGIMYINGDEINIGNVIVFAVCLGIAVDDTIHFIANFKIKKNKGMHAAEALKSTLEQTGKALFLTTVMLVIGFGMFVMGDFVPNQKFGLYCSIILTLALLADLVILPAILIASEKDITT